LNPLVMDDGNCSITESLLWHLPTSLSKVNF
jgi:hypothetical protein